MLAQIQYLHLQFVFLLPTSISPMKVTFQYTYFYGMPVVTAILAGYVMQADSFYTAKTLVELLFLAKCANSMNVVVIVGSYCSLLMYISLKITSH